MINALPGRPIRNNVSRTLERFHTYLLVVLGVAFIGTGITAIGVVTTSPAAVAVGAEDVESLLRIDAAEIEPVRAAAVRGMAPVVNQEGFYAAFGVKEGDKMYLPPEQRVNIW